MGSSRGAWSTATNQEKHMYHVTAGFSLTRYARTLDNRSRSHQHQSTTGIDAHFLSTAAGGRMLPTQRRQAILAEVSERSAVSAEDLAREFDVSVETIRRDLRGLQRQGLLDRVYGGATRPSGRSDEGRVAERAHRALE